MLTGSPMARPVAYDAFSTGISGRTVVNPTGHLLTGHGYDRAGLDHRNRYRFGQRWSSLREGDDPAGERDLGRHAVIMDGQGTGLEPLHKFIGRPLGSFAITEQQRDDGAALLDRDDGRGPEGSLDVVRGTPGQLTAGVQAQLKLLAVEVGDMEHGDRVLGLGIRTISDVILGAIRALPHGGRTAAHHVIGSEGPGRCLKPDRSDAPYRRAGRRERP